MALLNYLGASDLNSSTAFDLYGSDPEVFAVPQQSDDVIFTNSNASMYGNLSVHTAEFQPGDFGFRIGFSTNSISTTSYILIDSGATLTINSFSALTANLGEQVTGTVNQLGGTNTISGNTFEVDGTYLLNGAAQSSTALIASSIWEYFGYLKSGAQFTQSAFTSNSALGLEVLGATYQMNGGVLIIGSGGLYIGYGNTSINSIFNENVVSTSFPNIADAGNFTVGYLTPQSSPAQFNLTGDGSLVQSNSLTAQNGYVGVGGFGKVTQQSGIVEFKNLLSLGGDVSGSVPGNGIYILSGTSNTQLKVDQSMIIGEDPGSSGFLDFNDPHTSQFFSAVLYIGLLNPTSTLIIGNMGTGAVFQGGGDLYTSNCVIGANAAGTYTIDGLSTLTASHITLGSLSGGQGQLFVGDSNGAYEAIVNASTMDIGPNGLGQNQVIVNLNGSIRVQSQINIHSGSSIDTSAGYVVVGTDFITHFGGYLYVLSGGTLSGAGTIIGNLEDDPNSTVLATGGTLKITGNIVAANSKSPGTPTIQSGATLEIGGADQGNVLFNGGPGTTLTLDTPNGFTGLIQGLVIGDTIDLANTSVVSARIDTINGGEVLIAFQPGNAITKFNVSLALEGSFAVTNDGNGGTNLTVTLFDPFATLISCQGVGGLSGATGFDATGFNYQSMPGQSIFLTDPNGFVLSTIDPSVQLLGVTGGTDSATGKSFQGFFTALVGSTMVDSISTLDTFIYERGLLKSESTIAIAGAASSVLTPQAQQLIQSAFGLDPNFDLLSFDPIAGTQFGDASSAAVYVAGMKTLNLVEMIASGLAGFSGSYITSYSDAFAALAKAIINLPTGQTLNLSDKATVLSLIDAVAQQEAINVTNFDNNLAGVIENANLALDQTLQADQTGPSLLNDVSAIQTALSTPIIGTSGNDTFQAGGGNLFIDGNGGQDSIAFHGPKSEYTITGNADGSITVTDSLANHDGVDQILNVASLQFSDQTITLPTISLLTATTDNHAAVVNAGHVVTITMTTSEAVTVTGTPTLQLNDNEVAAYTFGSGTNTLSFSYVAQTGDNVADLHVTGLNLPTGASILDGNGNSLAGPVTSELGIQVDTVTVPLTSVQQQVLGLYGVLYDRAADFGGLAYWTGVVGQQPDGAGVTVANGASTAITTNDATVLGQLFVSTESSYFNQVYGAMSDSAFITTLYGTIGGNTIGIAPGITYWSGVLQAAEVAGQSQQAARAGIVGEIVQAMIDYNINIRPAGYTDAEWLAAQQRQETTDNKVAVSLAYSNASQQPGGTILDAVTVTDAAFLAATRVIEGVTYNGTTADAAISHILYAVALQDLTQIQPIGVVSGGLMG